MKRYFLSTNVHCCSRGGAFVFIDLNADEYLLVTGDGAQLLEALCAQAPPETIATAQEKIDELVRSGLITDDPRHGRAFETTRIELAVEALTEGQPSTPSFGSKQVLNFIVACVSATLRLRHGSLLSTVRSVARRKALRGDHAFDVSRARELTLVFSRLRRLFPANYLCLFDSMALIEFLARHDIYPTWVFGVKLEPWAAHCWVQHAGILLNEDLEEAASYTPILVV
jgi:hypothetical protein